MEPRSPGAARAFALAELSASRSDPARLRWMWGDALYLWSLAELDGFRGEERFAPLVDAYCARFAARPPRVDHADTCAPGLVAWAAWRRSGDAAPLSIAQRVIAYIEGEPRLVGDLPNHLGHSPEGRLYPSSIWVDSAMMLALPAARMGAEGGRPELVDLAARQALQLEVLLRDPATGLCRHCWLARSRRPYPRGPVFWGRGNGWLMAALPMIRAALPAGHPAAPELAAAVRRLGEALLPLQRSDGWWDTLLGPGAGRRNHREASATALIACGLMRAARDGVLDARCATAGARAFDALADSLGAAGAPPSLREVSAPTIPLPLAPRLGYALAPRRSDLGYGLAALFLAAIERERLAAAEGDTQ